jgi:hypothetical protein
VTPTKASGAIGVASVAAFAFRLPAVGNMYEVLANAKLSQAMCVYLSALNGSTLITAYFIFLALSLYIILYLCIAARQSLPKGHI